MSKKYNILSQENLKSLFRNSSTELLRQYFDNHSLIVGVDLEEEKQQKKINGFVDYLIDDLEKIEPELKKNKIKSELQKIFIMRDRKNLLWCIEDGGLSDNLINRIKDEKNNYNQAFILFLNDKENFDDFYFVYDVNVLNKGSNWSSTRTDYSTEDMEITDQMEKELLESAKQQLNQYTVDKEFCSKRVSFGDKEYIFGFYEDFPQEQLKIEDKKVETYFSNPIGKIVFFYDKKHRFVKIYAADRSIRQKMHRSFATAVFGKNSIKDEQEKNEVYDLQSITDQLAIGEVNFNINSADIQKIIPISIRFQHKSSKEKIEIALGEENGENADLSNVLRKYISFDDSAKELISYDELEPLWASFKVFYQDPFDNKKTSKKTITITNRNNVGNLGQEDVDFNILDCLKGSGILKQKNDND